jgi:hypothetical protein
VREVQVNSFQVDRKSLLGEPLDRSALRMAFEAVEKGWRPKYRLRSVYQVFEREIQPGITKIVETFSRDSRGRLKSFTESPLLKFSPQDIYALYDGDGALVEIPRSKEKNFSFPASIDVARHKEWQVPAWVYPENPS